MYLFCPDLNSLSHRDYTTNATGKNPVIEFLSLARDYVLGKSHGVESNCIEHDRTENRGDPRRD